MATANEAMAVWGAELQSGTLFMGAHAACADCVANQGQLSQNKGPYIVTQCRALTCEALLSGY